MTDTPPMNTSELAVIVKAAICGGHHSNECKSCVDSRAFNDRHLDELRQRIEALEAALREIADTPNAGWMIARQALGEG